MIATDNDPQKGHEPGIRCVGVVHQTSLKVDLQPRINIDIDLRLLRTSVVDAVDGSSPRHLGAMMVAVEVTNVKRNRP